MAKSSVTDFLKRLDTAPAGDLENRTDSQLVRVLYEGRALGKTDKHLHLATETGVLAIPLDQITDITPLNSKDSTIARVYATGTDGVQYVKGAKPLDGPLEVDPDLTLARLAEAPGGAAGLIIEVGASLTVFALAPAARSAVAPARPRPVIKLDDIIIVACW